MCGFFILREVIMGEYYIIGLLVIDSMCFVEREVLSYFSPLSLVLVERIKLQSGASGTSILFTLMVIRGQ